MPIGNREYRGASHVARAVGQAFGKMLAAEVWPPIERRRARRRPERLVPYDVRELDAGCVIEREHTPNRFKACKIARDHLREDPRYYSKLCSMWPKEPGCELVRKSMGGWSVLLMMTGLGIVAFASWRASQTS